VRTENLIHVDEMRESPKLTQWCAFVPCVCVPGLAHALGITERCALASSSPSIRCHCRHSCRTVSPIGPRASNKAAEAARQRRHVVCCWRLTDMRNGRTSCLVGYLALPARRDESMPLRCFAFHQGICLSHFSTNEAFLKTFKCCRTPVQRHPQRGVLGVHLKLIYRSKA
jgi:hypothetical protein